jgi:bifunctional UDP-N-acetylglucosamine pyrophosphorylase / glucosamine-1-phosphate N-acetyltransferase
MNIVILAAGKGTRMKSALPKVLHRLGGRPMLDHVLATAQSLKPKKIILVIGHGANRVKEHVTQNWKDLPIDFALQDPPQGTGHAVQQAVPYLVSGGITLVLYADVPLVKQSTLEALCKAATETSGLAVLTATLSDPSGYGRIVRDSQGKLVRIVEEKDADAPTRAITEINTGMLAASTPMLIQWLSQLQNNNAQAEYYLTDIIEMAAQDGAAIRTASAQRAEEIMGINSQAQRATMERELQARIAQALMDQGVCLADPSRIDVRGNLECGPDVIIDVGCVFEGDVRLEEGVRIGPHCVLRNCTVKAHAVVEAFSHLEQAEVGPKAVVGPYARLRPGSQLGEGAHVGNFVEIKNTQLGPRSKANHLSYLGDAVIGSRVNIGAGTITCNYDGAEKHRTVIEDDVFIGSDTQLVAPVTVGKGATLGAGTTLTHDAPANELTLSRTRQVTVKGYKRPHKKAH